MKKKLLMVLKVIPQHKIHSSPMFMFEKDELEILIKIIKYSDCFILSIRRKKFNILIDENNKPVCKVL